MAIIGGAGNPVGGSFTGPAEALEYVGNHVYAYSGEVAVPNVDTSLLKFTTSSHPIKVKILVTSNNSTADDYLASVSLNGAKVSEVFIQNTGQLYPYGAEPLNLIIPAYTEVDVFMKNSSSSSGYTWFATLTGRVYRNRD